jgi:hypothetical protein
MMMMSTESKTLAQPASSAAHTTYGIAREEVPRLAAAAPAGVHPEHEDADDLGAAQLQEDDHIHRLCEGWAGWCWQRRYFGKASRPPSLLGRLLSKSRPLQVGGPDAPCSAELHAFHLAVLAQPDALDRQVFEMHYLGRPRNIKAVAPLLGVSRRHWYTLLRDFRRRVYSASREILGQNLEAASLLPSMRDGLTARACASKDVLPG